MTWHAADEAGCDPATGRPPQPPGSCSPLSALSAIPVATWPVAVVDDDGCRVGVAAALGPCGDGVERLLDALAPVPAGARACGEAPEPLARATPAGPVELPIAVVSLRDGVEAAAHVDRDWLDAVDRRRAAARRDLVAAGRAAEVEAALHLAVLVGTDRLAPADDSDADAHVASGARLWLLTGAVVSVLAGEVPDPFAPSARLVVDGWWPVGPSAGRLVVSACRAGAPTAVVARQGAR